MSEGLEDRVDRLETGQETLGEKLDELLGLARKPSGNGDAQPGPPGRPESIAEQVRMELDRKEQEKADAAAAEAEKSEQQQIREAVAKLTEAKPVQPQRRIERGFWGPR